MKRLTNNKEWKHIYPNCVRHFKFWTDSYRMTNMEDEKFVRLIVEEVVTRFGMPAHIHSDQVRH